MTDGKRTYQIPCNLKAAAESQSKEVVKTFEKSILLYTLDEAWKENLRELDELRHSVQNASYEQKDPLLIYKLESYNLFKQMVESMNKKSISILMRGQIPLSDPDNVRQAAAQRRNDYSNLRTQKDEFRRQSAAGGQGADRREPQRLEPVRVEQKIGRNDPCPCGSGKKYKNCHGRGLPA